MLSLWTNDWGTRTSTTVAASALGFVSTLVLLLLSALEHGRSFRPSFLIQCFLVVTILLDLPRVRTQWLLADNTTVAALFTVTLLVRVVILGLESVLKWEDGAVLPEGMSREMMQGLFGYTFLWWLNRMFMIGYKRDIGMDDLDDTDGGLKGEYLGNRLLKSWDRGESHHQICSESKDPQS